MSTVTFDTLEAVAKLKAEGELATKSDLRDLENRLIIKIGLMMTASISLIAAFIKLF
jgi:hypothetical protein